MDCEDRQEAASLAGHSVETNHRPTPRSSGPSLTPRGGNWNPTPVPVPRPPSSQGEPQEPQHPKKPGCDCDGNCCPCCPCKPKAEPEPKTPGKVEITDEHLGKIADIIIKRMKENPNPWKGEDGKDGRDGNDGRDGVNGESSESLGLLLSLKAKVVESRGDWRSGTETLL